MTEISCLGEVPRKVGVLNAWSTREKLGASGFIPKSMTLCWRQELWKEGVLNFLTDLSVDSFMVQEPFN